MDGKILDNFCNNHGADQHSVLQYFEHLKQSDNGWQACVNSIINRSYINNDQAYFFLLQVVEHHLKTRYQVSSSEEAAFVRSFLIGWLESLISCPERRSFITNKFSQLFVLAFLSDYPSRWPAFFNDLLVTLNLGMNANHEAVSVFFKIMLTLHEEVVDRDIPHTEQEVRRNTLLKDFMREHSVTLLVTAWHDVLVVYESVFSVLPLSSNILASCLDTVGAYVSWIDISLVANDRFVGVVLGLMGRNGAGRFPVEVRSAACNCLSQIVSKGMDAAMKVKLVESIASVLDRSGLMYVPENVDDDDEEGDYLAAFAGLISSFGTQLVQCWQKFVKDKDVRSAEMTFNSIQSKLGLLMKLFEHEDDDVSRCVVPFVTSYVALLKHLTSSSNERTDFVKSILSILIKKMKYEDSYNAAEDDGEFEEYRKDLKVIYVNLSALDCDLFLEMVNEVYTDALTKIHFAKFSEVEAALYFLFLLGEIIPISGQGGRSAKIPEKRINLLNDMIKKMILSNVSCYPHPAVQLRFFETVVRYEKFFVTSVEFIPEVLNAFLDERGLWSADCHVRSRTAYLFSRFVKSINKQHIQDYLEMILARIQGLLVINTASFQQKRPDLQQPSSSSSSSSNDNPTSHLSEEDQQFMFETASILIIQSSFPPEKKHELMKNLVLPILHHFDKTLIQLVDEVDDNNQVVLAQMLTCAMSFISRTSKGFSSHQTVHSNGCLDIYTHAMRVFIRVLEVPKQQHTLHPGFRQFLHRMVVCLDEDVLQFTPAAVEGLMTSASIKQLYDFIPFLNQLIQKFKKTVVQYMQQIFVPIVSIIQSALSAAHDENDQVTRLEKKMLQSGYFSFIAAIINNDTSKILSDQNRENLEMVFETIVQGSAGSSDVNTQRVCFNILKKMVEIWDGNIIQGFREFVFKKVVPCCIITPLQSSFNINDAQSVLAINDIAQCLLKIYEKQGKDLLQFLTFSYLPSLHIPAPSAEEFCRILSQSDAKNFQNYLKAFCTQFHVSSR